MIYSRFGTECEVVRVVTDVNDVKAFENRKPDKDDRHNVSIGNYVVVKCKDDGKERLQSISFMRADDGFSEIAKAMRATGFKFPVDEAMPVESLAAAIKASK